MLILSDSDVQVLFSRENARAAVRQGAIAYSSGQAVVPPRVRFEVSHVNGEMLIMPGYLPGVPSLGMKVITAFPGNAERGLPTSPGAVVLFEAETGMPSAILDATYLTEVRTAAMTAVACERLARRDARVMGIIGTGPQARAHVAAIADVLPLDQVKVWSRTPSRVASFVQAASDNVPVVAAPSAEAAVKDAHIVIAATTATSPVVEASWVAPGAMVCGVGSHTPDAAELHPDILASASVVVVDTWKGAVDGAGDVSGPLASGLLDRKSVHELGELLADGCAGRTSDDDLTVFKSVGFAAVDLLAAAMIVQQAHSVGLGLRVDLR